MKADIKRSQQAKLRNNLYLAKAHFRLVYTHFLSVLRDTGPCLCTFSVREGEIRRGLFSHHVVQADGMEKYKYRQSGKVC